MHIYIYIYQQFLYKLYTNWINWCGWKWIFFGCTNQHNLHKNDVAFNSENRVDLKIYMLFVWYIIISLPGDISREHANALTIYDMKMKYTKSWTLREIFNVTCMHCVTSFLNYKIFDSVSVVKFLYRQQLLYRFDRNRSEQ